MNIKQNEGTADRILRGLVAVLLWILAYFWFSGTVSIVLYVMGFIMLFTAIMGFCGLYTLLGINTLGKKK